MTNIQTKIVDTSTGEEIIRDLNADELTQLEIDQSNFEFLKSDQLAKASEKSALLTKLGITAEEAILLLS